MLFYPDVSGEPSVITGQQEILSSNTLHIMSITSGRISTRPIYYRMRKNQTVRCYKSGVYRQGSTVHICMWCCKRGLTVMFEVFHLLGSTVHICMWCSK